LEETTLNSSPPGRWPGGHPRPSRTTRPLTRQAARPTTTTKSEHTAAYPAGRPATHRANPPQVRSGHAAAYLAGRLVPTKSNHTAAYPAWLPFIPCVPRLPMACRATLSAQATAFGRWLALLSPASHTHRSTRCCQQTLMAASPITPCVVGRSPWCPL